MSESASRLNATSLAATWYDRNSTGAILVGPSAAGARLRFVPDVRGDAAMVAQVLANLVENAIKYSPDGGRVEVAVNLRDERVRFEVRDHGLGIPLREHQRIFDKFYRLDPNLSRGIGGTGLGLYISRGLMRRMGGDIAVRSTPGEGSTFSFELPLAEATERIRATA